MERRGDTLRGEQERLPMTLWWYDEEWNIHWNAASDAVAAFRLAVDIAARLGGAERISYRTNAPWEPPAPIVEASDAGTTISSRCCRLMRSSSRSRCMRLSRS